MLTQETKDFYIERALMHQKADDFEQGHYWNGGKGCAVGCLAHDNDNAHETLSKELNTPEWIFHCADKIFEGLSVEESKQWPVDFAKALPVGLPDKEWDKKVKAPFLVLVLESVLDTFDHKKHPDVKSAVEQSIALWKRDDIGSDDFMKSARAAGAAARAAAWAAGTAWAAAEAAAGTAWAAAEAAAGAAAAWAAEVAAAWAAARAAEVAAAWAAARAARAARVEKYKYFADQLLRLMREAGE